MILAKYISKLKFHIKRIKQCDVNRNMAPFRHGKVWQKKSVPELLGFGYNTQPTDMFRSIRVHQV